MADPIKEGEPIFDPKGAIEGLGEEELFHVILKTFDDDLMKFLKLLQEGIDHFDYKKIREESHKLKGNSGYIHAQRLHFAAENLQKSVDDQLGEKIYANYPVLVIESIKFLRERRKYLCTLNKEKFEESDEDFKVPLGKFYQLKRKSPIDFTIVQTEKPNLPPVPYLNIIKKPIPGTKTESPPVKQEVVNVAAASPPKLSAKESHPSQKQIETVHEKAYPMGSLPPISKKEEVKTVKNETKVIFAETAVIKEGNAHHEKESKQVDKDPILKKEEKKASQDDKAGCSCLLL